MIKNRNFWILVCIGVSGFLMCTAFGQIYFRQTYMKYAGEIGEPAGRDFFFLMLSMIVGFGILMISVYGIIRIRHTELYLENQLIHAIVDSGCSLILEYCDATKEQRWLGDKRSVFKAKEGKLTLEQLAHPDDLPMLNQQIEDVKRGVLYSVDVRFKDAEGNYRICSFQMVPVRTDMGRPDRILGIAQDVDAERRRTEELIEEKNRLLCYLKGIGELCVAEEQQRAMIS